jgi:4-hydroxy-tetrahydrodipicolinate reductase
MGHAVAEAAVAAGLNLVPLAITGPKMGNSRVACGGVAVQIIGAEDRDAVFDQVLKEYPEVIVVDYTLPAAVNSESSDCSTKQNEIN